MGVLQTWKYRAVGAETAVILPDGCRDLLYRQPRGRAPFWYLSPLQTKPERVCLAAGMQLTGVRLVPGTVVPPGLVGALPLDVAAGQRELRSAISALSRSTEALAAMKHATSVSQAAEECGVSARSLQRVLLSETGRGPAFWLRLARARGAAIRVAQPLAELAAVSGFSDQAHLTREFRCWFGVSPRELRKDRGLRHQLAQPGLATGEQSSIR